MVTFLASPAQSNAIQNNRPAITSLFTKLVTFSFHDIDRNELIKLYISWIKDTDKGSVVLDYIVFRDEWGFFSIYVNEKTLTVTNYDLNAKTYNYI